MGNTDFDEWFTKQRQEKSNYLEDEGFTDAVLDGLPSSSYFITNKTRFYIYCVSIGICLLVIARLPLIDWYYDTRAYFLSMTVGDPFSILAFVFVFSLYLAAVLSGNSIVKRS